jgi:hypothetical protein
MASHCSSFYDRLALQQFESSSMVMEFHNASSVIVLAFWDQPDVLYNSISI